MPRHKDLPPLVGGADEHTRLLGACQNLQLGHRLNILPQTSGVSGMGHHEGIVKSTEQNRLLVIEDMLKHPEHLFFQGILLHPVMVVQSRLCPPTNVEGAGHVGLAPLHDIAKLFPVIHFLKRHMLHRRARDDQAVVFLVLDLVKGLVKCQHMLGRGVLGFMGRRLQ